VSGAAFGFLAAQRFCSVAAFGFLRLMLFGSAQSTLAARQAAVAASQQQALLHNWAGCKELLVAMAAQIA